MTAAVDTCQQRMVITAHHGLPLPPATIIVTIEDSVSPCPSCGNTDIEAWADDGESDAADWWECKRCGCSGAFMHMDLSKTTTPNGLTVDISTPSGAPVRPRSNGSAVMTKFNLSIDLFTDAVRDAADVSQALRDVADRLSKFTSQPWSPYALTGKIYGAGKRCIGTWSVDADTGMKEAT